MRVLVVPPVIASLEDALIRSGGLPALARREQVIAVTASWIEPTEDVAVLGAMQIAKRVIERGKALRRSTTGTGFMLRGGCVISMALPHLEAAFSDATPRTVLNRNLRPFMRAFEVMGARVQYFGREWLSWQRRALAVVALDMARDGVLLLEVFATLEGNLRMAADIATGLELACDRYRGRPPATLLDAGITEPGLLERGLVAMAERIGFITQRSSDPHVEPDRDRLPIWTEPSMAPAPRGATLMEPRPVPIGFVDVAALGDAIWIGGDMLAPRHALGLTDVQSPEVLSTLPMEGALWEDVRHARELARKVIRTPTF